MVVGIPEALVSLKAAFDIAKTIKDLENTTALNSAVINLQSSILTAQEAALSAKSEKEAFIARISDLEKEVADLKAWDAKIEEYELKKVGTGSFAYMHKENARGAEPPTWLCTKCFTSRHKSLLQNQGRSKDNQYNRFACQTCHSEIIVNWNYSPEKMPS